MRDESSQTISGDLQNSKLDRPIQTDRCSVTLRHARARDSRRQCVVTSRAIIASMRVKSSFPFNALDLL